MVIVTKEEWELGPNEDSGSGSADGGDENEFGVSIKTNE